MFTSNLSFLPPSSKIYSSAPPHLSFLVKLHCLCTTHILIFICLLATSNLHTFFHTAWFCRIWPPWSHLHVPCHVPLLPCCLHWTELIPEYLEKSWYIMGTTYHKTNKELEGCTLCFLRRPSCIPSGREQHVKLLPAMCWQQQGVPERFLCMQHQMGTLWACFSYHLLQLKSGFSSFLIFT